MCKREIFKFTTNIVVYFTNLINMHIQLLNKYIKIFWIFIINNNKYEYIFLSFCEETNTVVTNYVRGGVGVNADIF